MSLELLPIELIQIIINFSDIRTAKSLLTYYVLQETKNKKYYIKHHSKKILLDFYKNKYVLLRQLFIVNNNIDFYKTFKTAINKYSRIYDLCVYDLNSRFDQMQIIHYLVNYIINKHPDKKIIKTIFYYPLRLYSKNKTNKINKDISNIMLLIE
jgi:hypothetical protein